METIKKRLHSIYESIEKSADKAGRERGDIKLMAVSKLHPVESVKEAYNAGQRLFGENRVQEAEEKFTDFFEDAELHIIGHLQSNKVKKLIGLASCVQSIDKYKTADELEKRCAALHNDSDNPIMDIYLEYNTSKEETKSGYVNKDHMWNDLDRIAELPHIRVKGVMTIGPLTENEREIHRAFSFLRELFEETKQRYPELPLDVLSMGMTSDYEIAIEEGSTMLRIGSAIFGPRNY